VSEAIKAFEKNLEPNLKRLLADVRNASAKAAVVVLKRQLSMRNAIRAAYSDDQPRDKGGEWTSGANHQELGAAHEKQAAELTKQAAFEKNASKKEALNHEAAGHRFQAQEHNIAHFIQRGQLTPKNRIERDVARKLTSSPGEKHRDLRAATGPPIKSWAFDATNPAAQKWVEEHATELITDLSDTTREDIKDLLEQAFEGDFDVDQLTSEIADAIGDDERADLIARTETMRASNEGQQEAWDQAVEEGLLTGTERQEWIVTPDDRLCPICEPMDGVVTDLDGYFDVDGDQIDGPPAHPRCRCTIGLVV
jgi:SPP1 gp7 family putative phage head morphogenesis protein